MYSIEGNEFLFFLDITIFLGQKKAPFFNYHCKLHFIKWPSFFFLHKAPPFCKVITISNSVSRRSVNLDYSEIDSPDKLIRVEQRSGLYADNGLDFKYFSVSSQKL